MREITTTDLCAMEVINLCDGGRLGYPSALELCPEDGKITALIIPRECGFLGLGKTERYRIPWCRIECIGEDAILVKLTAAELTNCLVGGKGKRK
ncbi:MAG: YlmC/YmxH family sporulation protein [Clostridia bacterium]|nr:YlmC/YmxH family sporulation protein [Clostridia bacterium]MBQ7910775.1 YlmC/YmxH family sporulation protein [Clostridia bacterium]